MRFSPPPIAAILRLREIRIWIILVVLELCLGIAHVFAPYYVLPILLASILFMVMLINPEVSYYMLLITSVVSAPFSINIQYSRNLVESLYLANFIIFTVFISWMLTMFSKTRSFSLGTPFDLPFLLFLLWGLLSLFWTHDIVHGLYQWGRCVSFYLFYFLSISLIQSKEALRRTLWAWIGAGILFSGGTILGRFLTVEPTLIWISPYMNILIGFGDSEALRASSMGATAVTTAGLNLCIFVALGMYFIVEKRSTRRLLIFLGLFMLAGMVLPRSRLGVFGLLAGLIFFYSRFPQFRKTMIKVSLSVFSVVFFVYFATAADRLQQALERWLNIVVSYPQKGASTLNRLEIWATGFDKFIDSYWFGVGIGGLKRYLDVPHAHSIYFSVLFDLGFIGIWILAWLIATLVNTICNTIKTCRDPSYRVLLWAYGGGLVAIGVHGLTDFEYSFSAFFLVPFFIGLLMATARLATKEGISEEIKPTVLL